MPNGSYKRLRTVTEFIFHFCKDPKQIKFRMDRVLTEPSKGYLDRLGYLMNDDGDIVDGVRQRELVMRKIPSKVRPENVFRFSSANAAKDNKIGHPAPYHKELPLYFINLLTDEGDFVLDVFSGIGTTGVACREIDRRYLGYELNPKYAQYSRDRLNGTINL